MQNTSRGVRFFPRAGDMGSSPEQVVTHLNAYTKRIAALEAQLKTARDALEDCEKTKAIFDADLGIAWRIIRGHEATIKELIVALDQLRREPDSVVE